LLAPDKGENERVIWGPVPESEPTGPDITKTDGGVRRDLEHRHLDSAALNTVYRTGVEHGRPYFLTHRKSEWFTWRVGGQNFEFGPDGHRHRSAHVLLLEHAHATDLI
jgi:hypothetical protein